MTTTITPTDDAAEVGADGTQPDVFLISVHHLIPNPDNPRKNPGDLTELTRSVKAQGVIEPVTCLPADADDNYMLVCGHRRRLATLAAIETHPEREYILGVVRPWSRSEALDAMFSENLNRESLTVSEEVAGIELAMSLDVGLNPARLCRRIGKSQAWVRSRMSLVVLPPAWRVAIDDGRLSLGEAEAIATAADLGPEHIEALCEQMADRHNPSPARTVAGYRDSLRIAAEYESVLTAQRTRKHPVYTAEDPAPHGYRSVGTLFSGKEIRAHAKEPCHAVIVKRPPSWQSKGAVTVEPICTQPRRHSAAPTGSGQGSGLTSEQVTSTSRNGDDSAAKRRGRRARLAHATEVFARTRGGVTQRDLINAGLRTLVEQAGADPLAHAAQILGYDDPRNVRASTLLADADTPAALARVAGAVAYGHAEAHMYHWPTGQADYVGMLTSTGWEPDDWTASALGDTSTDEDGSEPGGEDDEDEPESAEDEPDEPGSEPDEDEPEPGADD